MSRGGDDPTMHDIRDERLIAGRPVRGDVRYSRLIESLRTDLCWEPPPPPSPALARVFEYGPASGHRRSRATNAVAKRFAAGGLALKLAIGAGLLGAGVATAGVTGALPGTGIVHDFLVPGGGDSTPTGPARAPAEPAPEPVAPAAPLAPLDPLAPVDPAPAAPPQPSVVVPSPAPAATTQGPIVPTEKASPGRSAPLPPTAADPSARGHAPNPVGPPSAPPAVGPARGGPPVLGPILDLVDGLARGIGNAL